MKNNSFKETKAWALIEKNVVLIFTIISLLFLLIFINVMKIYNINLEIKKTENILLIKKNKLENLEKYKDKINDINWIDYDIWLNKFASVSNLYIYEMTNNLNMLSQASQQYLDNVNKETATSKSDTDYTNIVKFIIIDKSKNTYLTNDIESISLLKNKVNSFSKENGELFNYVSNKGKYYNISYNTQTSPAYTIHHKSISGIEYNFVQAYWLPKNYIYSAKDESLLKSVNSQIVKEYISEIDTYNKNIDSFKKIILKTLLPIAIYSSMVILMIICLYFIGKNKIIKSLKNNFLGKILISINDWFERRSNVFKIKFFILTTSFMAASFIYLTLVYLHIITLNLNYAKISVLLICIYLIIILPKALKFAKYIDEIMNGIQRIIDGNLNHEIKEKEPKSLLKLAYNINTLNKGFKVSIEEQIKNEKLKSELVANVSHDLKTPLTSIINYTDILIREDISEEEKKEFLKILNRKSLKLKNLIEDLFEISKINSGKVELNKSTVDVVELVNQSIAEYSDTDIYTHKNLNFIVKPFAPKIEMNLDGHKISRVFENLITNALKYSLENTRVFVEIVDIKKGIKIYFKNTSKSPLDFDKKEIFERFSRGDKSRNSNIDGSGLGLAIAKSIVELHNGIMYIEFDGDLFKSIIELYY